MNIFNQTNKEIKENELKDKFELERTLSIIISDALKFTKKNNPIISMMPDSLTNVINQIKEERRMPRKSIASNTSNISFNLSFGSNASIRSINKYESNAFLKALGLDLQNLSPDNIKIDNKKAYDFIKKWKVSSKDEINKIIRYKVVKEIMNVEERRSVQKLAKINKSIKTYCEKKKKSLKLKAKIFEETVNKTNSKDENDIKITTNNNKEDKPVINNSKENKVSKVKNNVINTVKSNNILTENTTNNYPQTQITNINKSTADNQVTATNKGKEIKKSKKEEEKETSKERMQKYLKYKEIEKEKEKNKEKKEREVSS